MPINLLFAQQVRTQCFSKVIHKPAGTHTAVARSTRTLPTHNVVASILMFCWKIEVQRRTRNKKQFIHVRAFVQVNMYELYEFRWWRCGESNSGPTYIPGRCLQA